MNVITKLVLKTYANDNERFLYVFFRLSSNFNSGLFDFAKLREERKMRMAAEEVVNE